VSDPAPTWVAAVDLGATSVRVCLCDLEREPLDYQVVYRVGHGPRRDTGSGRLRWDWPRITAAVLDGLELAAKAVRPRSLASIGIDTWAVDYGLVDRDGELLADPVCYRDERTGGYRSLVERVGERRLYEINGLQCLPINTIFQLHAEDRDLLDRAARILTLPELLACQLTGGAMVAETTTAGATGLVCQATRSWSPELLDAAGVAAAQLPAIEPPGTRAGSWQGIPLHLVAGHDTASAVVGIAATEPAACFVSSGTWLLAGQELATPVLTQDAQAAQFTNEYGPEATTRFLKNIAGFWILEECRRAWGVRSMAELLAEAATAPVPDAVFDAVFDATDPRFLAPADMEAEVLEAAGLPATTSKPATVNLIVNSLAHTTAAMIGQIGSLTGCAASAVHLVGGGVRSAVFADRLRHYLDVPLRLGAAESAALGNAMVQGIALGRWTSVADARGSLDR
jgi:rhamnulokinase